METSINLNNNDNDDGKVVDSTRYKLVGGSLRYACNSRPYICHNVGVVSRFM